jgi:excinuclease ABC subunit C
MLSSDGEVCTSGNRRSSLRGLLSYFRCAYPEDKGARILREAERIEWEYMPSEFAALLEELRSIKRYRPRFNVAMKRDGRNYCFIKIVNTGAPKLTVVRGPGQDDTAAYYGPFMGALGVSEAVRELNDVLGLRDCANDQRMHFADQAELFDSFPRTPGCIRFEVRKVPGALRGGMHRAPVRQPLHHGACVSRRQRRRTHDLRCGSEMEAASDRLEFERAATLRDKLARLEALRGQFGRLRSRWNAVRSSTPFPGSTETIACI